MKKSIFLIIPFSILTLTACDVHFGNVHYDVPWWVIAIPAFLILLIAHIILMRKRYICTMCGEHFRLKWYDLSAWAHVGNKRIVKCPKCKHICECVTEDD